MSDFETELAKFAAWWDRVEEQKPSPFQTWDNGYAEGVLAGLQRAKEIYTEEEKDNGTTTN
jgi:hypothetical protein